MSLPILTSSTSSSFYSISLPPRSFPANSTRKTVRPNPKRSDANNKNTCRAFHKDASFDHSSYDGKLVDEDMIVLRMRIRDLTRTDDVAPPDWMEWERKYYTENYDSDICEGVGFLQSQLMNTRPSLALAMLGLFSLTVPISMGLVLLHLVDVVNKVMVGFHI